MGPLSLVSAYTSAKALDGCKSWVVCDMEAAVPAVIHALL